MPEEPQDGYNADLGDQESEESPVSGLSDEILPRIDEVTIPIPDEDLLVQEEPDEQTLNRVSEEWAELATEDTLEILEDPAIAVELSEDPVRLYLREIGQIHLLDADS